MHTAVSWQFYVEYFLKIHEKCLSWKHWQIETQILYNQLVNELIKVQNLVWQMQCREYKVQGMKKNGSLL